MKYIERAMRKPLNLSLGLVFVFLTTAGCACGTPYWKCCLPTICTAKTATSSTYTVPETASVNQLLNSAGF